MMGLGLGRGLAVWVALGGATAGAQTTVEVTGTVLDARNRAPIARALVHLGNRAVLTDHDGVFRFPEVTATSFLLRANKPGYYGSADGDDGAVGKTYRVPVIGAVEVLLYPEAVLTGTATSAAGEGLAGLNVMAEHSVYDDTGHHWRNAGQGQTGSDGGYRLVVPAGVYRLRVTQRGRGAESSEIVLPASVPANSSSIAEAVRAGLGEEIRADVRPEVRPAYRVTIAVVPEGRGFPRLTARGTNGVAIPLSPMPFPGERGEFRVALPRGTFTLMGSMQNQDGMMEARAEVTVGDHDVSGVVLRFVKAAALPVVIEVDSSATVSDNAKIPLASEIQPQLQAVDASLDGASDPTSNFRLTKAGSEVSSMTAVDGTYRFHARPGGAWYVSAATCGGVDLLTSDLPVSAALDGTEVRVRVSNNTGSVSGKVTVDGAAAAAWVYLLATGPSLTPVVSVRAGTDGAFARANLPPGTYRIVALERKVQADFQSVEVQNRYLDRMQTFTVSPGEKQTVTLAAVPEREIGP